MTGIFLLLFVAGTVVDFAGSGALVDVQLQELRLGQ